MNEQQFNAVRACEEAGAKIAEVFLLPRPRFYMVHNDPEITATRALVAIAKFLSDVSNNMITEEPMALLVPVEPEPEPEPEPKPTPKKRASRRKKKSA